MTMNDCTATLSNFMFQMIAAITQHARNTMKQIKQGDRPHRQKKQQHTANKLFRNAEFIFSATNKKSACLLRTTERGGWEGTDRTQFLWRKHSETEAHLHVAPLLGTSMSWLSGPVPCYKVSSQNQGLRSEISSQPHEWRESLKGWEGPGIQISTVVFWTV